MPRAGVTAFHPGVDLAPLSFDKRSAHEADRRR